MHTPESLSAVARRVRLRHHVSPHHTFPGVQPDGVTVERITVPSLEAPPPEGMEGATMYISLYSKEYHKEPVIVQVLFGNALLYNLTAPSLSICGVVARPTTLPTGAPCCECPSETPTRVLNMPSPTGPAS